MKYNISFWNEYEHRGLIDYEKIKTFVCENRIPKPRFGLLYISNVCNQNCRYCEYAEENKTNIIMPFVRVKENIDELKKLGIGAIEFCGGGEPTCHPEFGQILEYCRSKNIVAGLLSNFAFDNDKLLETIIRSCSYIRISLDTVNEEIYNEIRRPKGKKGSLVNVLRNIENAIKLKKKFDSDIVIGNKMLVTKWNYDDIKDFILKSIDLGVNNVQFKKVALYEDLLPDPEMFEKVISDLECYKRYYSNNIDIILNTENLILKHRCFTHINHIFIDAFGGVYLCCYYLGRRKDHKYGNVYENSVMEIWYGNKHLEVLENIDIKKCNQYDCRWIKYNNLLYPFIFEDTLRQLDFV